MDKNNFECLWNETEEHQGLPSNAIEFLKALKGQKINKFLRYSRMPVKQAVEIYAVDSLRIFTETPGPVLLYTEEGVILGVERSIALNSIMVWQHHPDNEEACRYKLLHNDCYDVIGCDDLAYSTPQWQSVIGAIIIDISIIKYSAPVDEAESVNSHDELGLVLVLDNGEKVSFSMGLIEGRDSHFMLSIGDVKYKDNLNFIKI